ncbi:hypothetical protein BGZ94_008235 [Podila epigama]|nr:hypothetical protein BGZ94_008235 [Podila epigama]
MTTPSPPASAASPVTAATPASPTATGAPVLELNLTSENLSFYAADMAPPAVTSASKPTTTATDADAIKTTAPAPTLPSLPSPTLLEVKLPAQDAVEPTAAATPEAPAPVSATKPSPTSPIITPAQPTVSMTIVEALSTPTASASALALNGSPNGTDAHPQAMEGVIEEGKANAEPVKADIAPVEHVVATQTADTAKNNTTTKTNDTNNNNNTDIKNNSITATTNVKLSAHEEHVKAQEVQIEALKDIIHRLESNLEESHQDRSSLASEIGRYRSAYDDLYRQHMDLQNKLHKKEQEYDLMSKNYLEHVRMIRATDDDHSTIMDRLNQLKANIEHLVRKAQGSRSVNLNKAPVVEHFKASGLLEAFPVPEDKLEPYQLNLYMESVIMSTLVSHFFDKPLSCVFEYNKGFKEIYDWMHHRNNKLAIRWRQQLCVMIIQDPALKERQEAEVNAAATTLTELFAKVYTNSNEGAKIRDICNKAFELAIAMTAMDNVISPETVPLGTPFDDEEMCTSLKNNVEGKVALVIFPAFKDQVSAFNVRSKVWCY